MNTSNALFILGCLSASFFSRAEPSVSQLMHWFKTSKPHNLVTGVDMNIAQTLSITTKRAGGGSISFNQSNTPCIVSIPHRYHDLYTYRIGEFLHTQLCTVLVSNTYHRNSESDDGVTMDLAKRPDSFHLKAIKAYSTIYARVKVFQIHGFSQQKRLTDKGKGADIILSHGGDVSKTIFDLAHCFNLMNWNTRVYPKHVSELGGTRNIMHSLNLKSHTFFHIELNKSVRKMLSTKVKLQQRFTQCLNAAL